jgi:tetratricopeptide (TPR) repeat protein
MKMRSPVAIVMLLVACGGADASDPNTAQQLVIPPMDAGAAPLVIGDASAPAIEEADDGRGTPSDEYTVARDPRAKRPSRSSGAVAAELHSLESQFRGMTSSTPGRADLARKIMDDYAELARSAGLGTKTAAAALSSSVSYSTILINDYPTYPKRDEVVYYRALAYEQSNQRSSARQNYYELIKSHPNSDLVPCAYFAFGEFFFDEASGDPVKYDLAKQAYLETLKYPPPKNGCFPLANERLAEIRKATQGP